MIRSMLVLSAMLWLFPSSSASQSEEADPYSVQLVRTAIKTHSEGVIIAKLQNHIQRMGDKVSVALLKDLNETDLVDPHTVELFLPVIRDCFSEPQLIEIEIDKRPKITLFLLKYVRRSVFDPVTQRDLDETIRFVTDKTAK